MNQKHLPAPVRAAQAGFTLVEIMVVIVILGLLATMVAKNVIGAGDEARESKARNDVVAIADAVRMYRVNHGKLPENLEVLATKDEKGRCELENLPKDPWDHDYEMREGNGPHDWEIISLGMDGVQSEDDISSKAKKDK
jgi:general secretion pathway protein G